MRMLGSTGLPVSQIGLGMDALAEALLREESLDEEQMRGVTGLPKRPAAESAIAASR